jgi:phosphatidylserine synthase
MSEEFLSPGRVPALRNLLFAVLGLAALLVMVALVLFAGDDRAGGVVTLVIAAAYGALTWLSWRAVRTRSESARRTIVLTAVVVIVLSVLLVKILVGLLTVIAGVGLLMVAFAPEREAP